MEGSGGGLWSMALVEGSGGEIFCKLGGMNGAATIRDRRACGLLFVIILLCILSIYIYIYTYISMHLHLYVFVCFFSHIWAYQTD